MPNAPPVQLVEKKVSKEKLRELLKDSIKDKKDPKKGEKFELFFETFMAQQKGFELSGKHIRSETGEIDYFYRSNICGHPVWTKCPYLYVECKNVKKPISTQQMNHFIKLVEAKSVLAHCGVYITTSYFGKPAMKVLIGAIAHQKVLAIPIGKKDLDELIEIGIKKMIEQKCDELMTRA